MWEAIKRNAMLWWRESRARDIDLYWTYLNKLEAQFTAAKFQLNGIEPTKEYLDIASSIKELLKKCRKVNEMGAKRSWNCAFEVEKLLVSILDSDTIINEAKRRYNEAILLQIESVQSYQRSWDHIQKDDGSINTSRVSFMKAEYISLLNDLHSEYNKHRMNRLARKNASMTIAITATILVLITLYEQIFELSSIYNSSIFPNRYDEPLITAITFGALGAFSSRLFSFQWNYRTLDYEEINFSFRPRVIIVRILMGVIGSLVLFFAISGKMIDGTIFPDLEIIKLGARNASAINGLQSAQPLFPYLEDNYGPDFDLNMAKLMIWSFLGGFSERLIPEQLHKLEAGTKENKPINTENNS